MYLRRSTRTKNGKTHVSWRLVRSVRRGKRVLQETVATLGEGRVVVIGDSAGADDGTGWPQDNLFDGWSDHDNAAFYLNGVSWLAGEIPAR